MSLIEKVPVRPLTPNDPREIGGYRLLQRVGAGGMGVVYLAEPPGGGEPCALKLIRPEHADDADFRARFDREVTLAHRVTGPFTARVLGADTTAEAPWLATEYVHGPELGQVVRDQGPLTEDLLCSLGAGLVEAFQAIHGVGLVHRDLKPSNVLVTEDGPRVIDFGIARAVDGTALTVTGQALGTPGYMAPELVRGGEPAPEVDVFALGGVLSYAATGRQPFGTGEAVAVLFRAVTNEPDLDGVPITLRSLVSRCLAKEPSARPSLTELHTAFVGQGGTARDEIPRRGWLSGAVATELDRLAPLSRPEPEQPQKPEQPEGAEPEEDTATVRLPGPTIKLAPPRKPTSAPGLVRTSGSVPEERATSSAPEKLWSKRFRYLAGASVLTVVGGLLVWNSATADSTGADSGSDGEPPSFSVGADGTSYYWGRSQEEWTNGCPASGPNQVHDVEHLLSRGTTAVATDFGLSLFSAEGVEVDRLARTTCDDPEAGWSARLAQSHDGGTLAMARGNEAFVWTNGNWAEPRVVELPGPGPQDAPDGDPTPRTLAVMNGGLLLLGIDAVGDPLVSWVDNNQTTEPFTEDVVDVAMRPVGMDFLLLESDGDVWRASMSHGRLMEKLGSFPGEDGEDAKGRLLYTPDSRLVHGTAGLVTVWDEDRELLHELEVPMEGDIHDLWVGSLEPSWAAVADIPTSDLTLSAVVGEPGAEGVLTWDLASGELVEEWSEGTLAGPMARHLHDGSLVGPVPTDGQNTTPGRIPSDGSAEPFSWVWD